MPVKKLLDGETVARFVPYQLLRKDPEGNTVDKEGRPLGVEPQAFELRPSDAGNLSVCWLEYFTGETEEALLECAVAEIRSGGRKVGGKSGFAVGNIGEIDSLLRGREIVVRFVADPQDDNCAHALVRRWPENELSALEAIAAGPWSRVVLTTQVSAPAGECEASERGQG